MLRKCVILACFCLLLQSIPLPSTVTAQYYVLTPQVSSDTMILAKAPDEPKGSTTLITVRNAYGGNGESDWESDALIKFNLPQIPSNAQEVTASLKVYYDGWNITDPSGRILNLYRITENWSEFNATWNYQPAYATQITSQVSVPASPDWMTWDVTADILSYIQGTASCFGWKIADETYYGIPGIPETLLRTFNYGSTSPTLTITYSIPMITVQTPNNHDKWYLGETHTISWASSNVSDTVEIFLLKDDNPTFNNQIASSIPNSGSYQWEIPVIFPIGTDFRIKIQATHDANIFDLSNNTFSIGDPFLTVQSPNGNEHWYLGMEYAITWSSGNAGTNVTIILFSQPSNTTIIAQQTPNTGYYNWKVPSNLSTTKLYKIQITSIQKPSLTDSSDDNFTITSKPSISITKPVRAEKWYKADRAVIQWSSENAGNNVKIELFKANKQLFIIKAQVTNNGSYPWTIPTNLTIGKDYKIKISCIIDPTIYCLGDEFSINQKPEFTISSPTLNQIFYKGSIVHMTWTSQYAGNWVKISIKDGSYTRTLATNISNSGSFDWTIPNDLSSTTYQLIITPLLDENLVYNGNLFNIQDEPRITATALNPSEGFHGDLYSIRWTSTNAGSYVEIIAIDTQNKEYIIAQSTPNDGEFTWQIPTNFKTGSYRFKIVSAANQLVFDYCQGYLTIRDSWFQQLWWLLWIPFVIAIPLFNAFQSKRKKTIMNIARKKALIIQLLDNLQYNNGKET